VVVRVFQQATRLSDYPQLGPLIALFASLAAVAMVGRYGGFRVPSLWFTVGLLLTANLSQVIGHGATVLVGQGLPPFLFLMLDLAAACPIAMQPAARRRLGLFMALVVLGAIAIGGTLEEGGRLELVGVAGGFGDPNELGFFAIAVAMFHASTAIVRRGLRSIPPTILAIVLGAATVLTVSRGAALALGAGLFFLSQVAARSGRRGLSGAVIVVLIGGLVAAGLGMVLREQFSDSLDFYSRRFAVAEENVRGSVYSWELLDDLKGTVLLGKGPGTKVTAADITAHNTVIDAHLKFGGPAALILVGWLIYLGWRVFSWARRTLVGSERFMLQGLFAINMLQVVLLNNAHLKPGFGFMVFLIEARVLLHRRVGSGAGVAVPVPLAHRSRPSLVARAAGPPCEADSPAPAPRLT